MFGFTFSMRDGRQQSSELSNMNTLLGVHIFELSMFYIQSRIGKFKQMNLEAMCEVTQAHQTTRLTDNPKSHPTLNFYPHFESSHLKFPTPL